MGKTRLAVEYAWQHRDEYSAVLFVMADSPINLQQNLAELAGPTGALSAGTGVARGNGADGGGPAVAEHLAAGGWGDQVEPLELGRAGIKTPLFCWRDRAPKRRPTPEMHWLTLILRKLKLRKRRHQPSETYWLTSTLKLLNKARPAGSPQDVRTWLRQEPLRAHIAFAVMEANRRGIAEPAGRLLNQLAVLLDAKALHTEVEPLLRRIVVILYRFHLQTGYMHPHIPTGWENYRYLLEALRGTTG